MKQSQAKVLLQKPTCNRLNFLLGATNEEDVDRLNDQTFNEQPSRPFKTLKCYRGIVDNVKLIYKLRQSLIDDTYTLVIEYNSKRFRFESVYYGNVSQFISSPEAIQKTIIGLMTQTLKPGKC